MLKALRQNPALYAQGSMQDAVREIDEVASFGTQTLTASEILDRIRHAENSLHAARAYLDMAKAKAKHHQEKRRRTHYLQRCCLSVSFLVRRTHRICPNRSR